jgi:hypothetical protein
MRPLEYQRHVRGFGIWRILYDSELKKWKLDYCFVPASKQQWRQVTTFALAEVAAISVHERNTGLEHWDGLGYGTGESFNDLKLWRLAEDAD